MVTSRDAPAPVKGDHEMSRDARIALASIVTAWVSAVVGVALACLLAGPQVALTQALFIVVFGPIVAALGVFVLVILARGMHDLWKWATKRP
jgi:uncharacterized MnhB-related membrane protein